jgi:hypothetical protein
MTRKYLMLAAVVAIAAAAVAGLAIAIELGLAFQSESDSSDDVEVGDYLKASNTDGQMVSIIPVTYIQSQDKETYVLNNNVQSVRGTMEVGTEDNVEKDLTSIISFQESGTWMLIETMTLTTQREMYFTVLVSASVTLSGMTVILISGTAEGKTATIGSQDSAYTGYKVWGVGTSVSDYVPSAHSGDSNKNFIVLVKDDALSRLTHRYNVLKITSGENSTTVVDLITPRALGDTVVSSGNWRIWNTDKADGKYALRSNDLYRSAEEAVAKPIYDSLTAVGVAGKQTDPTTVYTGSYSFSIEIRYKSQISIDPTPYHDGNMRSNVVFILTDKPTP